MRRSFRLLVLALAASALGLPTALEAQGDPRMERLQTEALAMVESRAGMVQEIVDMLSYPTIRRPPTLEQQDE